MNHYLLPMEYIRGHDEIRWLVCLSISIFFNSGVITLAGCNESWLAFPKYSDNNKVRGILYNGVAVLGYIVLQMKK